MQAKEAINFPQILFCLLSYQMILEQPLTHPNLPEFHLLCSCYVDLSDQTIKGKISSQLFNQKTLVGGNYRTNCQEIGQGGLFEISLYLKTLIRSIFHINKKKLAYFKSQKHIKYLPIIRPGGLCGSKLMVWNHKVENKETRAKPIVKKTCYRFPRLR